MNKSIVLVLVLLLFASISLADWPEGYHNPQQIEDFIFALQDSANELGIGNRMQIDTIGYSQQNQWPIYAVKVADDATIERDCTAVLFIGQVHAEEVSGVELVLNMIENCIFNQRYAYRNRREYLDMYFIPTANPEGMGIVFGTHPYCNDGIGTEGYDRTFRKNCRINPLEEYFRYCISVDGDDSSGVDINRNFNLNFFRSDTLYDTLMHRGEIFDYYRGPSPCSEAETQAIVDYISSLKPQYSATYHTSRSTLFSMHIMYPWDWGLEHDKQAPDSLLLKDTAIRFAELCSGNLILPFRPAPSGRRDSKMHDWMYAEGGWINMQTELRCIQPPIDSLRRWIEEYKQGAYYLMDRAYGSYDIEGSTGQLKLLVQDEAGNPIHAEVMVPSLHCGYFKPRMTKPETGTYRRPFLQGNYEVVVSAFGYVSDTTTYAVPEQGIAGYTVTLERMPHHLVHLGLFDGNDPDNMSHLSGTMVVHHDWGIDTLEVNDGYMLRRWPAGDYTIEAWADGYIPYRETVTVSDTTVFRANLVSANDIWRDGFEEHTLPDRWTYDGDFVWAHAGYDKKEGVASLKSGGPSLMLLNNVTGTLYLDIDMPETDESVALTGWRCFELEPDYDFCTVEISVDDGDWEELEILNGFSRWQPFFYDLRPYLDANSVEIRWTIAMDHSNDDRGLFLDEVALVSNAVFEAPEIDAKLPGTFALENAYPNPFNPTTMLTYSVAANVPVTLKVFDVLGREVMTAFDGIRNAGQYRLELDMSSFATGIYFVRMDAPGFQQVKKLVLVK